MINIKKMHQYFNSLGGGILLVEALPLSITGCGFSILITEEDLTILFSLFAPFEFYLIV